MIFLLCCLSFAIITNSQKSYHCEYKESVHFPMPDSVARQMRAQFEEKGFGAMADQIIAQLKTNGIEKEYFRIVDARTDSTFILIKQGEEEGNVKMNMKEQHLLFTKGKMFRYDDSTASWKLPPDDKQVKEFKKTNNTKKILSYDCVVYISTDSTTRAWVTTQLPSYLNPGIRMGAIPGAILAFEIKTKDSVTIRSEIDKFDH
jgi:GLPGLI family protein